MSIVEKKPNRNTIRDTEPEKSKPVRSDNISDESSKNNFYKKFNALLIVLLIITAIIFLNLRFNFLQPSEDKNNSKEDTIDNNFPYKIDQELEPEVNGSKNILNTTQPIIPTRTAGIINGHEHIKDLGQAPKWLTAMEIAGVSTTVMVGSPDATFYLNPSGPFEKYLDNNEELFKLVKKYPEHFIAFPTIYTYDDNKLELLKSYINRGATGLKLFTGHYATFYDILGPLNHSTMYPVYEYCERERIPIIWHVHLGIENIKAEFEEVLEDFPNLIINVPHFMLSSINLWQNESEGRLREFLETYPNLYTDISFGFWAKSGLWRISNHTTIFKNFIIEFQDRFTFGTDMVCTNHPRKNVEWITNLTQGYIDILEKRYFNLTVKDDMEGDFNGDAPGTHNGLELPEDVLDKIYYDNMVKFLNGRFYYEELDEVINESDLVYQNETSRGRSSTKYNSRYNNYKPFQLQLLAVEQKCILLLGIYYYVQNTKCKNLKL